MNKTAVEGVLLVSGVAAVIGLTLGPRINLLAFSISQYEQGGPANTALAISSAITTAGAVLGAGLIGSMLMR